MQQQQELAQLVGEVGFQAAGTIAQKFNLADGSPEKIALHAAVMSGGAVGAVLAGNGAVARTGAAVALDGERYNRQLHPQVKPFISNLAKKQRRFSEEELQAAARVVLGNDRIANGTRRSYDSETQAAAAGVSTVSKAPDGRYYEAVAASPEAIAYVTAELRTGPMAIQTEFNVAQLEKLKYDHKPWQNETENSGLELLNTITVVGSNGAAPTVQGGAGVRRRAGSGVTHEEKLWQGSSIKSELPASTPTGSRGNRLDVPDKINSPVVINGGHYSGHALDRMQAQGISPTVVDNPIHPKNAAQGKIPGTTAYFDVENRLTVIINTYSGRVITVDYGRIKQ